MNTASREHLESHDDAGGRSPSAYLGLLLAETRSGETSGRMPRIVALAVACLVFIIPCSAQVHAEAPTLPVWMRVRSLGSEAAQPNASPTATQPSDLTPAQRSAKRGAYMTAAGTGLIVAGVVHAGMFGNKRVCYDSDDRQVFPIITGAAVAAAGTVMTIVGVYKMRKVARAQRPLSDGMSKFILALTSASTAAVASGLLFAAWIRGFEACVAS